VDTAEFERRSEQSVRHSLRRRRYRNRDFSDGNGETDHQPEKKERSKGERK
jgi:hypothetical protein